jgi:hypothetical protein
MHQFFDHPKTILGNIQESAHAKLFIMANTITENIRVAHSWPFSIILDFIFIPFSSKNEAENETRKDMKMFIFDKMEP